MRIAVIGAGIGGLAVASGMSRQGHEIVLFERAARLTPIGSGLSLFANAMTALDALGLGDAVRDISDERVARFRAGQRRPDGSWLARTPADAVAGLRIVHRARLHEVLLGALPRGVLRLGAEVTATASDGSLTVRSARGGDRHERFDLVVAADGIRSRVRASWPGDPGIRYSGYSTWRGVTDRPVDLQGDAGETWGRGLRFGMAPLADGRVYWFGVATLPEGTVFGDELAELHARFDGWHAPVGELIAATAPDRIARHDIHDLAGPVPAFARGRVVLLGDAAHAMTPDLGQGGGQALEDAATLVRLIGADGHAAGLASALSSYDALRRARTQPIARRARMVGRLAQAGGPVLPRLRDLVIGLTPPSALRRQLRDLQEWQPPEPAARRPLTRR